MQTINTSLAYMKVCLVIILVLNLLSFQLIAHAAADADTEMKVLSMYFNEDQLVVSATRTLKRLSQVPENMEIITSEDIERMNAHTLADVLEKVNGMFVSFYGHDFGSDASLHIQGSDEAHVLVLLDGIVWNTLADGNVITNTIPVRIIKRIEIIKGPASSAWGSSLGGVINIVTKEAGKDSPTASSVTASYGERGTYDLTAEALVDSGSVRYYIYAGSQESDGLKKNRWYKNDSFYTKINVPVSSDVDLMFTAGYSEPNINDGDDLYWDQSSLSITRDYFTTASLTADVSNDLSFDTSVFIYKHKFMQEVDELTGTWTGVPGALLKDTTINERSNGLSAKLVYTGQDHVAVLGADYRYSDFDSFVHSGAGMISWYGAREIVIANASITRWAVFVNDTISFGKLTVTPGIRYDYNNMSGSFLSPSIGATYRIGRDTILRASIAKGFNTPSITAISTGGLFTDPNPDLAHEKVWSYQAGIEAWAADYMKIKLNVFHHDIDDALWYKRSSVVFNKYFNRKSKRDGVELGIETAPFYDISIRTGYTFVHKRTFYDVATSQDTYLFNLALRYDDRRTLFGELAGHYLWWDEAKDNLPEYDAFLWDLNINKKLSVNGMKSNLFITIHNILNESQYTYFEKKNPGRWMEAGLRIAF